MSISRALRAFRIWPLNAIALSRDSVSELLVTDPRTLATSSARVCSSSCDNPRHSAITSALSALRQQLLIAISSCCSLTGTLASLMVSILLRTLARWYACVSAVTTSCSTCRTFTHSPESVFTISSVTGLSEHQNSASSVPAEAVAKSCAPTERPLTITSKRCMRAQDMMS
ncbi:MAG TPA: hypothetical protein VJB16_06010, partial [archaeon]|nr:hypothetical protein [archaeon]